MPINTSLFESYFDPETAEHQLEGIQIFANQAYYAVFDEQGTGKTMQAISAACIRFMCDYMDALLVIAPKNVVGGWLNSDWGEIKKHCFVKHAAYSFRQGKLIRRRVVDGLQREGCEIVNHPEYGDMLSPKVNEKAASLHIIVTNYDQIRNKKYRTTLFNLLKKLRVGVVIDESHKIKHYRSAQTKACKHICRRYPWRLIMTGTPRGNSILDLYSQYDTLSPLILKETPTFGTYRAHYAEMGGHLGKQVLKELNMAELQALTKPYTIRRLKKDCLDLPDKLYSVVEAFMPDDLWRMYVEMKEDLIATLIQGNMDGPIMTASNGAVKHQRLHMLCSGLFVDANEVRVDDRHRVIHDFKNDEILDWRESIGNKAAIIWCLWRKQRENLVMRLKSRYRHPIHQIYGGQKEIERDAAMDAFSNPLFLGQNMTLTAQPAAGGSGLNLVNSHYGAYGSTGHSYIDRSQSEDRQHRRGQRNPVLYVDFIAVGPKGQKTVEYQILKGLKNHEEMATLTAREWVKRLREE